MATLLLTEYMSTLVLLLSMFALQPVDVNVTFASQTSPDLRFYSLELNGYKFWGGRGRGEGGWGLGRGWSLFH